MIDQYDIFLDKTFVIYCMIHWIMILSMYAVHPHMLQPMIQTFYIKHNKIISILTVLQK